MLNKIIAPDKLKDAKANKIIKMEDGKMFRIFKYVEGNTVWEQSKYRMKQMRESAGNKVKLEEYKQSIVKYVESNNNSNLLILLEKMFMEKLTLDEIIPLKNMDIDTFIDDYKNYGILGFVHCCY